MKLTFNIDYRTNWGEAVYITAPLAETGAGDYDKAVKMRLIGDGTWQAVVELPDNTPDFVYRYFVRHENGYVKNEWGHGHRFHRGRSSKAYEIYDRWQDQPWDKPFYSTVFTECVNGRKERDEQLSVKNGILNLSVAAPMVAPDQVLAICGECEALGEWDPSKAVRMNDANFPEWSVNLEFKNLPEIFDYKFLILDKASGEVVAWEGCDNRTMAIRPAQKNESARGGRSAFCQSAVALAWSRCGYTGILGAL